MKQVVDLNFRKFAELPQDYEIRPAATLTMEEYLSSKEPGRGKSTFLSESGHQIVNIIGNVLDEVIPDRDRSWGDFFVYRDHFSHPGYVSKLNKFDTNSRLLSPEVPISELCFDRVIGLVDIVKDNMGSARLAIKYESDGLCEIVLGYNVKVCSNFSIFNGDLRMQTSKRAGIDLDVLVNHLTKWLRDIEAHHQFSLAQINRMSEIAIGEHDVYRYLGEMLTSYYTASPIIPVTDINALAAQVVRKQGETNTLWDFYNRGTEVLRFDNNSGNAIFDTLQSFNGFMSREADYWPKYGEDAVIINAAPVLQLNDKNLEHQFLS